MSIAYLTGNDEPMFAESFHDILTWAVLAEEILKKEKVALSEVYEVKSEKLLSDLVFHYADSHTKDLRQGSGGATSSTGATGGGSATVGGTAYTQTALVTYDLGSGVAPFAVAQSSAPVVTYLNADKLDDEDGSYYIDRANHAGAIDASVLTGEVPVASIPDHATTHESGGTDAIKLDNLASPDDTTDLDATASAHGLLKKLSNTASEFMDGTGNWSVPTVTDPAGSDTQVQYNDGGSFGGDSGLTYNETSNVLTVTGGLNIGGGTGDLGIYTTGTWSPADGSGDALSTSGQEAFYIKIGLLVFATCTITYPVNASGTAAVISGLPFTIQDTTNHIYIAAIHATGSGVHCAVGLNNTTTASIHNSQGLTAISNADLSNTVVRFTLIYQATS